MAGRAYSICKLSTLLPFFAAGCGGHTSHGPASASGGSAGLAGTTSSSGGSAGLTAAMGEATGGRGAGETTAANDASAAGDVGTLVLEAVGGPSGGVATDVPIEEPGVGPEETCSAPLASGACQLTSCKVGGIGSPRAGYGDFGPISASVGTTTVQLSYGGFGYGTVYFPMSVTLGTGGIMVFHGGGAPFVPAFDVSATIPGLGIITSPVPATDGGAAIIDTSRDLSVTWLPISIGHILFHLDGGDPLPGGTAITLECTFEGASGAGVVPHALLSSLKEMSATAPTYAGLSSELDATTVVDGLIITTRSYQNSATTNREFNVTLQ